MPWNKRVSAAGLFALLTASCDLPGTECTCTEMACLEGITVELRNLPDSAEWTAISLSLQHADTVEPASNLWGDVSRERHRFISRKLVSRRPESIRLHLDYRSEGSENRITLDTNVRWQSRVCNACSGGSSCKDDMAFTADLAWDLQER